MENTPRETNKEPVLLSWELDPKLRRLYRRAAYVNLLMYTTLLPAPILILVHAPYMASLLLGMLFAYWSFRDRRSALLRVVRLTCTSQRLQAVRVLGSTVSVPYSQVKSLRQGPIWGSAILSSPALRADLYLELRLDIRDKLIAILREASNARIIGFDSEAS